VSFLVTMPFINGLSILCLYQLLGESGVRLRQLPVPGAVLGMVLLFLSLLIRRRVSNSVEVASTNLLSHLSLLFVPAGVGVITQSQRLLEEWLPITLALVLSTVITMAATATIMQAVDRWFAKGRVVERRS